MTTTVATTAFSRARCSALAVALLLTLPLLPSGLQAQQPHSHMPSPADSVQKPSMQDMMAMMGQMGPMYETMSRAMIEGTLKAMLEPDNIERMAQFSRRYFDALVKQGFTPDQALQIVAGAGMPSTKAGR